MLFSYNLLQRPCSKISNLFQIFVSFLPFPGFPLDTPWAQLSLLQFTQPPLLGASPSAPVPGSSSHQTAKFGLCNQLSAALSSPKRLHSFCFSSLQCPRLLVWRIIKQLFIKALKNNIPWHGYLRLKSQGGRNNYFQKEQNKVSLYTDTRETWATPAGKYQDWVYRDFRFVTAIKIWRRTFDNNKTQRDCTAIKPNLLRGESTELQ